MAESALSSMDYVDRFKRLLKSANISWDSPQAARVLTRVQIDFSAQLLVCSTTEAGVH